jgi:copper transport protein
MISLTLKKSWLVALLATLVSAIVPSVASAHATLVRSDPSDNAILAELPREVRLWFSEAISSHFSSAQILDINGQVVATQNIRIELTENLMILTLPDLPPGLYSVRWRVLSEADGHFTQGLLVFGVGEDVNPDSIVAEIETRIPPLEVLLRWLNFTVLLTLVGSVGLAYLVLRPAYPLTGGSESVNTVRRAAQDRVLALATGCAGLALAVGVGLLLWQVSVLLETLPASASIGEVGWQLLNGTRWGMLWLVRQGVLLVLLVMLFRLHRTTQKSGQGREQRGRSVEKFSPAPPLPHPSTTLLFLMGLLLLALLAVQALTGHAAASPNPILAVVVDVLHLLAASLWAGGLLALMVGLFPLIRRDQANFVALARAGCGPFSRLAALSVGLLIATGLYNTGRQVVSLDALIATLYGQALLGKLGLMLTVGVFGLLNSMLLHPRLAAPLAHWLRHPPGWTPLPPHHLPILLLAEASLGVLVLLVTSLITSAPPARGAEFTVAAEEIPTSLNQTVDDMLVTFSAKPNRPGQNVFTVRAVSTRRPPPAEIMRVILRFTFLGEDLGRTSADAVEIEPGLYQVGGRYLSLAGAWQVQVVVRRRGIEDSVAQFNWIVAPPVSAARPVIISKRPLEPGLTLGAGAIALILLVISVAQMGRGRLMNLWSL